MNIIYRDIETGLDIDTHQVDERVEIRPNTTIIIGDVKYIVVSTSQESSRYARYPYTNDLIVNVIKTTKKSVLDDNVYRFAKGRLVPFGKIYTEKYLPDGIWYVHHEEYSEGHTNADRYIPELMGARVYLDENGEPITGIYKIGEAERIVDLPELCGEYELAQKILGSKEFKDWYSEKSKVGYSLNEIVCFVTSQVITQCSKLKKK